MIMTGVIKTKVPLQKSRWEKPKLTIRYQCKENIFNSIQFNSLFKSHVDIQYTYNYKHIIKQYELYQPILYRITRDYRWKNI